jgi:hypothetical protein
MLDQLVNLVKQFGQKDVVENQDVPNEHNEGVMQEATKSIAGGLQNALAGGGLQNILGLFGGGGSKSGLMSNPLVQGIIGSFAGKLLGRFGLNPQMASGIAGSLIPNVLNGLINKANDPNDKSVDIGGILNSLTGGQASQTAGGQGGFDIGSLISQFTGGGQGQAGGGGGLQDIIGKLAGGALQERQSQEQQGGLLSIIGNLFGK